MTYAPCGLPNYVCVFELVMNLGPVGPKHDWLARILSPANHRVCSSLFPICLSYLCMTSLYICAVGIVIDYGDVIP